MIFKAVVCFILLSWGMQDLCAQKKDPGVMQQLSVSRLDKSMLQADGSIREDAWQSASRVRLSQPWNDRDADVGTCSLLSDSRYLYFLFTIKDSLLNLYVGDSELSVARGDRVEMFFTGSTKLDRYFCFEMSPAGRILDYRATFYRKMNYGWHQKRIRIRTHVENNHYTVEGRLPMKFLKRFFSHNKDGISLYAGVFSADYHSSDEDDVIWSSWIMPESDHPDFHIPSAFGKLIFNPIIR